MSTNYTNLRAVLPEPQKDALVRLLAAVKASPEGRRASLGSLISEALHEYYGIAPDGSDGFPRPRPARNKVPTLTALERGRGE